MAEMSLGLHCLDKALEESPILKLGQMDICMFFPSIREVMTAYLENELQPAKIQINSLAFSTILSCREPFLGWCLSQLLVLKNVPGNMVNFSVFGICDNFKTLRLT